MNKSGLDKGLLQDYVKKNPKETAIADVLAFVAGCKEEENKKDSSKISVRFTGQFEITNRLTGEEIVASEAFMPGMIESFVHNLFLGTEGAIRTAFQITVRADKESPVGYVFGMKLLTDKASAQDPFKELRGNFPAIPKLVVAKK